MAASDTGRFTDALADLDVGWTRTTAAEFPSVLTEVVEPPAVGAPLAHEGVSLDAAGVDVGERLAGQFAADEAADRRVVASGTSCLDQLDSLLDRHPQHPVEVVAPERGRGR